MKNNKLLLRLFRIMLIIAVPLAIWCTGILFYVIFPSFPVLAICSSALLFVLIGAACFLRPVLFAVLAVEAGLCIYFAFLTPAMQFKDVKWQQPWARRPSAEFLPDGRIRFCNVRDFIYKSEHDYTVRYRSMTVDPEDLQHIDLALSHWDGIEAVAHTMLGLKFGSGDYLCLSLETRIPEGRMQSAVGGLFKQYEIIPLLGTYQDIFDLRIKHRGEDFYLYPTTLDKEKSRRLLLFLAHNLDREPQFYNTLTRNCTTALDLFLHFSGNGTVDDIRLYINGFSDQLLYRLGYLKHRRGESFASLKSRCFIPGKSAGIAE